MKTTKLIIFCFFVISLGAYAQHDHHKTSAPSVEKPVKSLSPHTSAMAMINGAHVHVDYSSPSVRERIIFGGLVGYNNVWQAGAHKATWIETDKNLLIGGKKLTAGKYAFFVIPGKESWEVMFNTRWDQHGKDEYNETENVLVLNVKPVKLDKIQESLIYKVEKSGENEGLISFAWEKVMINLPFTIEE